MARKKSNKVKLVRQPKVKIPEQWKCLTDEEFALYARYKEEEYKTKLKDSYVNYVGDPDVNGENFIMGKHIQFTCSIIQLFLEDRLKSQNDPTKPAEVLMISFPPQHGKSCSRSTATLTADGWKNHGDLKVGDYVFGPDGKPKKVLAEFNHCDDIEYKVIFKDHSVIEAHANHEWVVYDRGKRKKRIVTTKEMYDTDYFKDDRARYLVDPNVCVEFSEKKLPLEPYVFGLWLGDGTTAAPYFTHDMDDMGYINEIESYGYKVSGQYIHPTTGVPTTRFNELRPKLKEAGFLSGQEKYIPTQYKLSSREQRLELLAGLIDSDGYVYQDNGRVTFSNTNRQMIEDVREVCVSLGFRTTIAEFEPRTSSSGIVGRKTVYQLSFNPDINIPTALERKKTIKLNPVKRRRGIVSIEKMDPKPGKCITVEGGVYLVGENLIPTHNSMSITETLPSWYVGFKPEQRVIVVSYGDDLARRFGRRNKQKLKDNEVIFTEFDLVRDSDTDMFTSENGSILSRGIGAGVTGQSADLIIVDDPIKNREEAESQKIRNKIFDEYRDSLLSRLSANGKIIIIMTRWHEDDLIGRIASSDIQDFFYLNLPCEAEENDLLGREVGDALFAEIGKDKKWLAKKKKAYSDREGMRSWLALYQGRPTAQEGNMFKRHYWRYYDPTLDMPKYFDEVLQSWDCAFKDEDDSDYVCGTIWGRQGGNYYLLDLVNERMDIINTMKAIENMSAKWPKSLVKLVEDKANGPAVIRLLRNKVPGLIAVTPDGGKVARANAILGAVESGNVYLPIPDLYPWVLDFIEQCASFPQGSHDKPLSCLNPVNCWKPLRAS